MIPNLKEIPIKHIKTDELPYRDLSLDEIDEYGIDYRYAQFMSDFPHAISRVTNCWEYTPLKLIIELNGRLYLYEIGVREMREIRFFDDSSELTDEEWDICFGYRLREKMYENRMYRYELSEASGISESNLSRYMNGKTSPTIHVVDRLAKALHCSPEDFLPRDFYFVNNERR